MKCGNWIGAQVTPLSSDVVKAKGGAPIKTRKAEEEPEMAVIVPENGRSAGGIGKVGPGLRHIPVLGAGAAAHHHHGLVGIVFVARRVVVGGDHVAIGENLNRGVVIVDAETAGKAGAPANIGHRFAIEIGKEFVHVIEGLRRIGATRCGDGVCFTSVKKKNCVTGEGLGGSGGACTTRKPMLPSDDANVGAMLARLAERMKYGAVAG